MNTALSIQSKLPAIAGEVIERYGATSGIGTFRTCANGLMMSADWSEEDNTSLRRYFRVCAALKKVHDLT